MKLLILLIFIECPFILDGQEKTREDLYYEKVKQFYHCLDSDTVTIKETYDLFGEYTIEVEEFLFFKNCKEIVCDDEFTKRINSPNKYSSSFFKEIRKVRELFLDNKSKLDIDSLITNSKIYDEDLPGSIAIDVKFSKEQVVYFYLNRYPDEKVYITNIYLANGESFYNRILKDAEGVSDSFLYRFGVIDDLDGYTNVRSGKGSQYSVVAKVLSNQVFQYTPNCYSNWWRIRNADGCIEGYMHKSRIVPLGTLPDEARENLKYK